jgi:hypothetical protein
LPLLLQLLQLRLQVPHPNAGQSHACSAAGGNASLLAAAAAGMPCDQAGPAAAAAPTQLPQLLKLSQWQAWQERIPALEGSKHLAALAAAGAGGSCA